MNALRALVAPLHRGGRFFGRVEASGGHEASLELVADGTADVTALDCVTHALLTRHRPSALKGTRVLTRTGRAPAPPFVSSSRTPAKRVALLRKALTEAMKDPALEAARDALLLTGISVLPMSAYQPIADMRRKAENLGFDQLP
jgi:ABC-type phosphate/phosphonate transport system substrate-binding protein